MITKKLEMKFLSLNIFNKYFIYKIFLTAAFLLFFNYSYAQNITPVTQNIAGAIGTSTSNYSITYSVGEMVSIVNYVGQDKSSLNAGFLQSFTPLVTGLTELVLIKPGIIMIAPNPVLDVLHLKANFLKSGQFEFNIVDASSNLKYQTVSYSVNDYININLNIINYVSGVYYVRVLFKPNNGKAEYGIYKFVKL